MTNLSRRTLLTGALATSVTLTLPTTASATPVSQFREIEQRHGGRIGVAAYRAGRFVTYRADERFAICSTFKMLCAAAVLRRARLWEPGLMTRLIRYSRADLVANSPVTELHVDTGMIVTDLCDAMMRYSDNTAANLLLRHILGGPRGITRFARGIGDRHTRLNRYETELNTNLPGDKNDTTTPADMAANLEKICLGNALAAQDRATLVDWMVRNTTGDKRIRAGLPAGWVVGDRTGTGERGAVNDVAVAWPPDASPLVIAVYTTHTKPDVPYDEATVAEIARVVASTLYR